MTRVGRKGLILGPVTIKDGAAAPVNTVPPAIPASAVIGTQLVTTPGTWTGATTLTYQWQRNTGSWVDIGGATSANYTPVDADFGRALRVVETADGAVSANSNETGLTAEAPVQSLGAELLTDGNMEAVGTAAYTVGFGANISKDTTVFNSGTQSLKMERTAGGSNVYIGVTTSAGDYCEAVAFGRGDGTNFVNLANGASSTPFMYFGTGTTFRQGRALYRAANSNLYFQFGNTNGNLVWLDDLSVKKLTANAQLTAPSANMRITQYYTLPGSPEINTSVWVMPRISDFAAGNYWLALLEYAGQWNITLFSVATHTRTSRIAAVNIGTTNGLRVTADGDDWTLETTANGGTNWTSRGTVSNNTYNAATGVNVLWASSFTIGNLLYEVP